MKKIFSILIAVTLVLCLGGCDSESTNIKTKESNSNIRIWTDKETGVQYVIYKEEVYKGGLGGITPRLNADGTLYTTEKAVFPNEL